MKTIVNDIVEHFDFGLINGSIHINCFNEKGFKPFVGGCGVGKSKKTLSEARKDLHIYLKFYL